MANQMYGYNNNNTGGAGSTGVYNPPSSYAARYHSSATDMDHRIGSSSSSSSLYNNQADPAFRYNDIIRYGGAMPPPPSWSTPDVSASAGGYDSVLAGIKRQTEAFYHQSVLGNHNSLGQTEALFSTNTLAKRPRFESATNLPIYPQRPGAKDCAHYMLTRTCKFADSCKFDHPIWVPEGGIPDWKEVPLVASSEALPERPGEPDCPYFLKTQKCKFGFKCKFNHPKDKIESSNALAPVDASVLPERPSEPPCSFYMKTGKCKFGATCKFHHPKDIQIPPSIQENGNGLENLSAAVKVESAETGDAKSFKPFVPSTPALLHNSKGLPVRLGEVDCPFYLKTGSCKYGATCRYNHPDRSVINPPVATGLSNAVINSPAASLNFGVINPAATILPSIDPRLAQTTLGVNPPFYPQRPGQMECDFYMKTGECKFGESCRFHHPVDRSAPTPSMTKQALQQNVKLTLAGFPRREGTIICPFYLKTGTCKYGVTCRFDHPPPGEAIAMATVQGTSGSVGGEGEEQGIETTQEPQQ